MRRSTRLQPTMHVHGRCTRRPGISHAWIAHMQESLCCLEPVIAPSPSTMMTGLSTIHGSSVDGLAASNCSLVLPAPVTVHFLISSSLNRPSPLAGTKDRGVIVTACDHTSVSDNVSVGECHESISEVMSHARGTLARSHVSTKVLGQRPAVPGRPGPSGWSQSKARTNNPVTTAINPRKTQTQSLCLKPGCQVRIRSDHVTGTHEHGVSVM